MACASTVAVVVPSPATSEVLEATSRTICAPMFSRGSRSSISFATVTPSLVMTGAPNFFSITALRPLGPRVIFTASARMFTPRRIAWREFSPVTICFAIRVFPPEILCLIPGYCAGPKTGPLHYRWPGRSLSAQAGRLLLQQLLLLAACGFCGAAELGQNFLFPQDQKLLIVDRDFRAAVFSE